MNRRCLALMSVLFWLSACGALEPSTDETAVESGSGERQILVMMRLPPQHFRPDVTYTDGYPGRFGRRVQQRLAQELAGEHNLKLVGDWPMPVLGVNCFVMELESGQPAARVVEQLSRDPRVESVQAMNTFHVLGHDDPLFPLQPGARRWQLAKVHEMTTGRNVRVAEIDSGVELDHPDLKGRIALARNFVDGSAYVAEIHGTEVAGIIAARADDGTGIAGVAPDAELMALRACWQEGAGSGAAACSSFTLAKALQFAIAHDPRVINLSLGGPRDRLLERLMDVALARGIAIVGAVDPQRHDGGFPASHPGVLAVAGEEMRSRRADALLAPSRDIPATIPGGNWTLVAGSSFAAAQMTGLVALLEALNPQLAAGQLHDILAPPASADTEGAQAGAVDAWASVVRAANCCLEVRVARSAAPH